jgi:tetratricopeptide (TPR) repeat protein
MTTDTPGPESAGKNRRWTIPPAYLVSGPGIPGTGMLDELSPGLSILLWQAWRDADLWAGAPPELRRQLFQAEAFRIRREVLAATELPEPVREAIETLVEVLRPGEVSEEAVTEACLRISEWAANERHGFTAVAFGQIAALTSPVNAGTAVKVGLVVRHTADYARAEAWYRRAIALGRRGGDWKSYALAYCGLANLYMLRGALPTAEAYLLRALRTTRRYGLWAVRGMVLHDLAVLAANAGRFEQADLLAIRALKAYGKHSPRIYVLAHDIAWSWMLRGFFSSAIPIFKALLPKITSKSERLIALSNLARAAGAAGQRDEYAETWDAIWRIVNNGESTERVAEALIGLARGAASLRDVERAHTAAQYALGVALLRKEAHVRLEAESVIDSLARAETAAVGAIQVVTAPGREPHPRLSARLLRTLASSTA